jgi:hypothetical protein
MTQKYRSVTWQATISREEYKITGEKTSTWYQKILKRFDTIRMKET